MRNNKRKRVSGKTATTETLFDFTSTIAEEFFARSKYPFEVLKNLPEIMERLSRDISSEFLELSPCVFVHKTAKISPFATIESPCIICKMAEIRSGAYIRGNAIIGENCVVGNSTEIKGSILLDGAKAPHYNYVGDSILGKNVNLGAGAILSNLRLDGKSVRYGGKEFVETGMRKLGGMIGDNAEIGCNCVATPGTIVKKGERIAPLTLIK